MAKVTVSEWVKQTQVRIDAVRAQSTQDVIRIAQKRISRGGKMPVDLGFLINSGIASLNNLPSGAGTPPDNYNNTAWAAGPTMLVIKRAKPSDVFYFGWVANYAKYMEARYAFMRLAAQQWPNIVDKNSKKLQGASRGN